jgi:ATPase subunit of ABC transporter with duplicated ATPase domains
MKPKIALNGKNGAGKSTLLKFYPEKINLHELLILLKKNK